MQDDSSLNLICNYGGTNINKELVITPSNLLIKSGETVDLEIKTSDIKQATFSANYIKLAATSGIYVIRGIKPHGYSPTISRYSLSDSNTMKKVRSFLEAQGIKTSFNLFVVDRNVVIFLASFALLVALGLFLFALR